MPELNEGQVCPALDAAYRRTTFQVFRTGAPNIDIRIGLASEDLDALLLLIHERKADLVGALLLAYGYARAPKVETAQPEEAALEEKLCTNP